MVSAARLAARALAALVIACVTALAAPACGPETCGAGQTQICLEDGTTCTCPRPCASYDDCVASATDANDVRYCYGGDLAMCLPANFFVNKCRTGQACTGGICATTGACEVLCSHSSECASGCCAWDHATDAKNPTCAADATGKTCIK